MDCREYLLDGSGLTLRLQDPVIIAFIVHAAARHEAEDLERLAHITRVKVGVIGPVATAEHSSTHGPMALN